MRTGPALSVSLPLAIFLGLGIGKFLPAIGDKLGALIDPLVLALLALIFFEVRFAPLRKASEHFGFVSMVWVANFIFIPVLGWGLASLFFEHQSSLYAGLFLYFLFPCTDWFLAFTRIARGDVALGSVLIPINLISQLLLFPIYLSIFLGSQTNLNFNGIWETFGQWFLFPFVVAVFLRFLLTKVLSAKYFEPIPQLADSLIPWVLSLLVFCIFGCHDLLQGCFRFWRRSTTDFPSAASASAFTLGLRFCLWLCPGLEARQGGTQSACSGEVEQACVCT